MKLINELGGLKLRRSYILDVGVLALYFAGNKTSKECIDRAYSGEAVVLMCEINVAEFLYNHARVLG